MNPSSCNPLMRRGAALALTLAAGVVGTAAHAQPVDLDQSKLIKELAERNMSSLLLHLADTGSFEDAAEPRLITIGQHRIAFQDASRTVEERLEALAAARAEYRELIDSPEFANHPQRPVWRTDLAELLLVTYLEGFKQMANGFYELGVPSADQAAAFEDAVPDALEQVLRADAEFLDLDNRLSRDAAAREKLERSLAYYTIFDDYRNQKTAYFGAYAALYGTLLPDDHPYFQNLGAIPGQRNTPAEERKRLLYTAVQRLEPFVNGDVGNAALQARAKSIAGRATLGLGDAAAAESEYLNPATQATSWSLDILAAWISKAKAQEKLGRATAGRSILVELGDKTAVKENLGFRLMVADALHLMLLRMADAAPADRQEAERARAYQIYFDLIDDPSLGPQAQAVRNLVFDRWATSIGPDQDLAELPPAVRMAICEISRLRGLQALQRKDEEEAKQLMQRAIEAGQTLTDRAKVGDAVWATGTYNLAFAKYATDRTLNSLVQVIEMCTDVAEQTPDQPVATEAIGLASQLAETLHSQYAAQPGVEPAFKHAMDVLYNSGNYDTTQPADDRLVYYAYATFQSAGEYAKAAEAYNRLVRNHPRYVEAQGLRIYCLTQVFSAADAGEKEQAKQDLLAAVADVQDQAQQALDRASTPEEGASAARALANGRLAQAEVAASEGDLDKSLRILDSFDGDFGQWPDLIRRGLERRIVLLVEAGQLQRAQEEAGTMMGRFPDAAAGVIDNVIDSLETKIDALGEGSAEAAKLADTGAAMAKLLADWAQGQGFDPNQMLPYHLVVLNSLRVANRPDEALAYLADTGLEKNFGNNVDVLFEKAQALIGKGDDTSVKAASPILNKIIGGLQEPYPDVYWKAWVARLKINLLLNERVDEVSRRVRQLEGRFPNLGGEPYASQLRAMAAEADMKQ